MKKTTVYLLQANFSTANNNSDVSTAAVRYHDVAGDVGDLQGERQHVQLTHDLENQLGVRPGQLQKVQQVRRVAKTSFIHVKILRC